MSVKKVAFIGLRHGHITSLYQRIKKDSRFEIVAVCEEDAQAAKMAAESWNIETTHTDFNAMLAEVEFDILAVGDYYGIRGQLIIRALKAGKHVIADKPICTSLAELAQIRTLSAEKKLKVACMLDLRYDGAIRTAKKLVEAGRLGKIHAMSFTGQHPLSSGTRPMW